MNLPDARTWFRFRGKITTHINETQHRYTGIICNAGRYRTMGADETQKHLEECEFTWKMRKSLNLEIEWERMILWRKITRALKKLYQNKNNNHSNVNNGNTYDTATGSGR